MPGPVSLIFPRFVAARIRDSDGVTISIQARTSNQIAELTRAQSIDFGFADAASDETNQNLYRSVVITADCPVAVPKDHPLAQKSRISFADMDGRPIGTLPASHRQTIDLAKRFETDGLAMRATIESQTFLPLLHFVAAGQCCTIADPLSVFLVGPETPMVGGIEMRPMVDPIRYHYAIYSPVHRPISVIARNLLNAWQAEVMEMLEDAGFNPRLESMP